MFIEEPTGDSVQVIVVRACRQFVTFFCMYEDHNGSLLKGKDR